MLESGVVFRVPGGFHGLVRVVFEPSLKHCGVLVHVDPLGDRVERVEEQRRRLSFVGVVAKDGDVQVEIGDGVGAQLLLKFLLKTRRFECWNVEPHSGSFS